MKWDMSNPGSLLNRAHRYFAVPDRRKFFIYVGLLWILNAADVWQTLQLKRGGNLAGEANELVNYVLTEGPLYFLAFKGLAMFLVTLILIRGYFDRSGFIIGETHFNTHHVRTAIQFLLVIAILYYLLVVYTPLIILVAKHHFS